MNPLDRLSEYLRSIEKRLRVLAWTRGAAIAAGAALIATVILVLIANSYAFSSNSLLASRTVLFLALALALGGGLLLPLLRLNRRRAAREAENKFPEFEQRLLTFTERANANASDPFLELLARTAERGDPGFLRHRDSAGQPHRAQEVRSAHHRAPGRVYGSACQIIRQVQQRR